MKVALFHNTIAPYRIPLFEGLSEQLDLTTYFNESTPKDRRWELPKLQFKHYIKIDIFNLIRNRYHIFIGADPNLFGTWAFFIVSRLLAKPFILWTEERDYSNIPQFSISFRTIKTVATIISKNANICIALSKDAKQRLLRIGVKNEKIIIGPNAYPINNLRESYLKGPNKKSSQKTFLSLSYIVERKGIQYLIEAFKKLQKERENITLIIAGMGPYLEHLKSIANNHKKIIFLNYVSEQEKIELYKKSDIFVLPSTKDPWGLTVNEAMICEKPIITTHDTGARELIHDNGYVIPSENVEALYDVMKTILDQNLKEMGLKSWEIIQGYSIENEVNAFLSAIRCATNG